MKWYLVLALGVLQAGAALATPPDIIDIRDEVFGFSAQSIFLLRSARDNLGLHNAEQRDVFLVTVDRASGAEMLQPVYRARRYENGEREAPGPGAVWWETQIEAPSDAINPWQALAGAGGVPYGAGGYQDAVPVPIEGSLAPEGKIRVSFHPGWLWQGEGAALLAGIGARLDAVAAGIGNRQRMGPLTVGDLLEGQVFTEQDCRISEGLLFGWQAGGPPSVMVRLDCGDPEGGPLTSLLVALPESWREELAP